MFQNKTQPLPSMSITCFAASIAILSQSGLLNMWNKSTVLYNDGVLQELRHLFPKQQLPAAHLQSNSYADVFAAPSRRFLMLSGCVKCSVIVCLSQYTTFLRPLVEKKMSCREAAIKSQKAKRRAKCVQNMLNVTFGKVWWKKKLILFFSKNRHNISSCYWVISAFSITA